MAKFSLPALDFTIRSPIQIKKKKFTAYKDPKAVKTSAKVRYVKPPTPPVIEEDIKVEEPTFVTPTNGEIGDFAGVTIEGQYAKLRKEILDEQLRKLGHVKRFTVQEVIPALVQLFESKRNRRFKKFELMAMEGYVHGIGAGTLGTSLNQGPFEANKIQMKNGKWRTQRNNASWRIEMAHWNSKANRYECNAPVCIKCETIMEFYNA